MSLYENINRRKRNKSSRSKKNSTISKEAYANMKAGFPKKKKKKKTKQENIMGYGKTYGPVKKKKKKNMKTNPGRKGMPKKPKSYGY